MRYAVVNGAGSVVNVAEWDGNSSWEPPKGTTAIVDTTGGQVSIGWTYENGAFKSPPAPPLSNTVIFNPKFDMGQSMNAILTG